MKKIILVTGPDLDPQAELVLADNGFSTVHTPPYSESETIREYLEKTGAPAVVSRMGRLDADVIDASPNLKVISKHGVGVDNIDIEAAGLRGIPVLVATGANAISVAEHAIALMLAVAKKIVPLNEGLHEGRWEKSGFVGYEVAGSTMGLFGMGAIAQATAFIAKGLQLNLIGFDPFAPDEVFEEAGVERCESFEELLSRSNILSLHAPLTDQTRDIINADALAQMPDGNIIINTARGGLIDENALLAAIQSGHIAGAGLDTFAVEPPATDHPFFAEHNIVVTPHIGGVTRQAGARVGVDAVQGILDVLNGRPIPASRVVNRKFLPDDAMPRLET